MLAQAKIFFADQVAASTCLVLLPTTPFWQGTQPEWVQATMLHFSDHIYLWVLFLLAQQHSLY